MRRVALACLALALVGAPAAGRATAQEPPGPAAAPGVLRRADPPPSHPPLEQAVRRQEFRQQQLNLDAFLDSLGVAKGSTVLDIGAGPGYAAFRFAERLQGTGAVYATDIRQDFVDHIGREARRRGLDNLTAALVSAQGLDAFYARQRYDLVFLSNVYHCLDARVDYFTALRGFLRPGARLVVILYNQAPLFSEQDFARPGDLVARLAQEPPESPFIAGLSDATRRMLREPGEPAALKAALVEDFNRMLLDARFYLNFYRDSYFTKGMFSPPERDLANWLLMTLAEDGALDATPHDERALRALIRLNRLFFANRFGAFLAEGGRGAYFPVGDANRHTSKHLMLRELEAAGYRRVGETRLSPYYDAVIMAPQAAQGP